MIITKHILFRFSEAANQIALCFEMLFIHLLVSVPKSYKNTAILLELGP